ncbi:spinocerebellar ataxia type 10 protein domain-containing protein [Sphaerosporella brunnea]|uniref:Ataxin-10 homolog n=1 Tax=Sphaerosporella brunnea TaxID=1250544 RepID=A0A5J5EF99_9PEZI|nr:spinocerebellar ataxia type 10 protein domain-containing protein [Sphaerosporella brunnea]
MALLEDLLVTLLFGVEASFTHPGILIPTVESTGDAELKNVVKTTQRSRESRETLGFSERVWKAMTETLLAGNDQLVHNKHHLLPKVWDLVLLARNLLAAKERAQNLAAEEGFDAEVRRLLSICIEKASKPVSPNLDKAAHEKEIQMKGGYKKVMITALQFFNNLMTCNETRKLHVWLHIFGTPSSMHTTGQNNPPPAKNTTKNKAKKSAKPQPSPGSGVGVAFVGGTPVSHHNETAAKCNSLSAGFNAKYYKPGFLTDVPRLLQPDEIEPLLMILQSGIVVFEGSDEAMQSVRCKLMLAQGYGRSLLREVLVFLGAWEVDEDDFCSRVLGQIVEAILLNGLIPYAYECFRDDKDIVTPAQSVLLKLLASVYRPQSNLPQQHLEAWPSGSPTLTGSPLALDSPYGDSPTSAASKDKATALDPPPHIESAIPTFFVNAFRKQVLPPVIKIIQLQGAIRKGKENKEAFELSLWDLDRIYEGIYQFLELLVLFSEDEDAKQVIVTNEKGLVTDLVRLLGEMDKAIPRYVHTKATKAIEPAKKEEKKSEPPKHLVERPFDVRSEEIDNGKEESEGGNDDDDGERELVDPDEFTWPSIKRFIVVIISSLAWGNRDVQDLVRESAGVQVILNQCKIDDDNPFIREHSIMCLRALLQGNPENQKIVEELNAREVVPNEVLDKHGYATFIDPNGRIKLKKTD